MNEEEARETLKTMKENIDKKYINTRNSKAIETVLSMLEEKDKIIDLMSEAINNNDIDEDICRRMGQKENCNEFEDKEKCKECIKQYFENKAKELLNK